jgi:phage shock protein C
MYPRHRDHKPAQDDAGPSRRWLYRDTRRAGIAGVCAGIADYFGVSVGLLRFLTFLNALFFTMPTMFSYVIAALVLQRKPEHLYSSHEKEAFWRLVRLEPSRTTRDPLRKIQDLERRLRAAEARVTSSEVKLRRQFQDLDG